MLDAKSLRRFDGKLRDLLELLDRQEPPDKVAARAKRFIDDCTGTKPDGSLVRPNWDQTWQKQGFLASEFFSETEYIDKLGCDALFDVFEAMVRLVLDGQTPSLQELHAEQLRGRIRQYLAVRGYEVRRTLPVLNEVQQKALAFIKKRGPIGGKEIAKYVGVTFEHFRRWVGRRGALTAHGVRNDRNGAGYYWRSM